MKKIFNGIAALAIAGTVLFGCQADKVAPQEGRVGGPSIAGAAGGPHPMLDTLCQTSDTLWLVREDNGSPLVDKCFGVGGVSVACNPAAQMKWGGLVINEGYLNTENYLDCNFWMAPGWFCNFNDWDFGITNSFVFDQNGIPVVGTDWSSLVVNPVANKWQLRLAMDSLPTNAFDLALRVGAVKLNLFGAVVPGSQTTLWGRNADWNTTGDKAASNSPWVMHFSPARCLDGPEAPVMDTTRICEVVYTGLACTGNTLNSTVLHPTTTETGVISYAWSNGTTTQDLAVSPTVTTDYAVVISVDGVPTHVVIFTVNVIDVACTITQGGGGNGSGGSGSGGSGSGNGSGGSGSGNGSGGSGSGNGSGGSGSGNGSGGSGSGNGSGGSGSGGSGSGNGNDVCGNGNQVTSSSGASNASKVLGAANNQGALFSNTGNSVVIKLAHALPAGTQYQIHWKKSGAGTASMRVFES
ncbi:MAG: hypothetical protein RLZZ519_784, partial [Bacteroidota bacterium]